MGRKSNLAPPDGGPRTVWRYNAAWHRIAMRPIAALICATLTLAAAFLPIWFNFADVGLVPAYLGYAMMVTGLRPLWRLKRWGIFCVFLGSVLLFADLAYYVARLAYVMWQHPNQIHWLDVYDVLILLAFVCDLCTMTLLARRLRPHRDTAGFDVIPRSGQTRPDDPEFRV